VRRNRGPLQNMELHQLEAFVAVGLERSFSRAARLLHIPRPAISREINRLEDELNVTLLRRKSRTVSLTLAGCSFFLSAQRILSLRARSIKKARQRKSSSGNASSGNAVGIKVSIGAVPIHNRQPAISRKIKSLGDPQNAAFRELLLESFGIPLFLDARSIRAPSTNPAVTRVAPRSADTAAASLMQIALVTKRPRSSRIAAGRIVGRGC
jgi:hypothetical protein